MNTKRGTVVRGLFATLIVFSAQLACPQNHAQNRGLKVVLDPAQTEIHWTLGGALHTTHGTFKLKTGELFFNPATGVSEGEILVDATTGESGNATRDKRMHDEVLESNRYPAIFFHPSQIKGAFEAGDATQDLVGVGTFNIHGEDHPLQLPLKVKVTAGVVTATTQFTVPYVDWGMKNPSKFMLKVSKEVEIEVNAKGTIKEVD
jgi:hypothetical protein